MGSPVGVTTVGVVGAPGAGRGQRANQIRFEHGRPIRFGEHGERGVVMRDEAQLEIVDVARVGEDALVVHDAHRDDPSLAFARPGALQWR